MKLTIYQTITIHSIKIGGLTNSSVLQIGSAGLIKPVSNIYNTGGYTEVAPELPEHGAAPLVPLPSQAEVTPPETQPIPGVPPLPLPEPGIQQPEEQI